VHSTQRIHYSGALRYERGSKVVTISAGWAVCVSGYAARSITTAGNTTTDVNAVTCTKCMQRMRWAGLLPEPTNVLLSAPYPCTVINDRYHGQYSGGAWVAFPLDAEDVPAGADAEDFYCEAFWATYQGAHGVGATPDEAVRALIAKMPEGEHA
jgi:hypothetical protein